MSAVSRRRFLRVAFAAGGAAGSAAILAACGGAAPAAPTPTTAVVAKPFATTAPAAQPAAPTAAAAAPTAAAAAPGAATKPAAAAAAPTAAAAQPGAAAPAAGAKPAAGTTEPLITAKPPARPQPVTLRFHFRAGGDKSEPSIYVERPGEWSKETGHKIELEPIPAGREYPPKIIALASSGTLGDIMFTSVSEANHFFFVQNKLIEPSDDYMPKYNIKRDEWVSAIIKTLTIGGKMYGMPKASNPAEAHYIVNLKLMEEAGLKKPEIYGNTFETLREWGQKLSKGPADRRDVYGIYIHTASNQSVTNAVRARGSDLVDAAGEKSLVDSPQFDDWLQYSYKIMREDKTHPMPDVVKPGDSNALAGLFANGKIAISQIHRSWVVAYKTAIGDKFPYMYVYHPRLSGAKGWVANIDTHSATTQSKYKDEAFTLSYALADRRFALVVGRGQGYLTGRVDNLEAIGELGKDPFLQIQQKATEEEDPWWIAKNLRQLEVEAELVNQLDTVWLGKRPPDKAFIADLKKALDGVLSRPPL